MKKSFLLATAAVATLFVSCAKEHAVEIAPIDAANLTIKISSSSAVGRAIEDTAAVGAVATIDYTSSYVFVATTSGAIKQCIPLTAAVQTPAGQNITGVPAAGQVFVLSNVPTADKATVQGALAIHVLQNYTVATAAAGTFPNVVLSNATGAGQAYTATGSPLSASVAVTISPAVARLELASVKLKAGTSIKSFSVQGIYLDKVAPEFTLGGGVSGTALNILNNISNANVAYYQNTGVWAGSAAVAAVAGADKVWAYQIPTGTAPNVVVAVSNVVMLGDVFLDGVDGSTVYYLTARLSNTTTINRANVYKIAGGAGIEFDESNLHDTPNPDLTSAEIDLVVTVLPWAIGTIDYTID